MTPEQMQILLKALESLQNSKWTLTGALDWPIFIWATSFFGSLIVGLICYMWRDLKNAIKDNKSELRTQLKEEIKEREKQDNIIWKAVHECQEKCCPRGHN